MLIGRQFNGIGQWRDISKRPFFLASQPQLSRIANYSLKT
jgi:hypothetical protein